MNLPDFTPDSILFDLDGTLWDATHAILAAWENVLRENPDVTPSEPVTLECIRYYMGLTNEELGAILFPQFDADGQMGMMRQSCAYENKFLGEHGGVLYPNVLQTLEKLSAKYPLFIISNCQCGYIEGFLGANGGAAYIRDYECADNTGLEKAGNIRLMMERHGLVNPVFVGDTTSDSMAAEKAGVPFIYAKYGFGEAFGRGKVTDYTYYIDRFDELAAMIK
ncbi:MAG: HAD family hydrolase [Ruminococcaceae bacterium]|nr:HAD family hydrolase [Oscillospiraceae bacterium]